MKNVRWLIQSLLALAALAALLWLILRVGGFTLDVLRVNGGEAGSHDPMFAEPAETNAPQVLEDGEGEALPYGDNSANWDNSVNTPVDQTAEELGRAEQDAG